MWCEHRYNRSYCPIHTLLNHTLHLDRRFRLHTQVEWADIYKDGTYCHRIDCDMPWHGDSTFLPHSIHANHQHSGNTYQRSMERNNRRQEDLDSQLCSDILVPVVHSRHLLHQHTIDSTQFHHYPYKLFQTYRHLHLDNTDSRSCSFHRKLLDYQIHSYTQILLRTSRLPYMDQRK